MLISIHADGSLRYKGRWCVPNIPNLKKRILDEAHLTPYSVHPGGDKLYKDLKIYFWWPHMKQQVAEYVSKCLTCQKVNYECNTPLVWKWDSISMDFISGLP